ncbi:SIMPL domain-containing protein [Paenibacillus aestuarii]|uniref:SIMPL domain-containing protein n=1 Tax=Paenibacillus aestuarii TaxID=516965 RepID=A0ABW0KGM1_9BACL|nr:SIMPL domain-containing protein [Paenibacillus aestuarii]
MSPMYGNPYVHPASAASMNQQATIEVLGEGTVQAAPDRAVIVLGAVTEGTNLTQIQAENAKITTAVIQSLLALGIPREHIQTQEYRIDTQYDYPDGKQTFRGYKVTHLLQVTTDRVEQTGAIVDAAVASGANEVSSIRFTMAHPEVYEQKALTKALRDAQQKAVTIADTIGAQLSAVPIRVQEPAHAAEPVPYSVKFAVSAAASPTPIQPGQLTISATVRVWYLFA